MEVLKRLYKSQYPDIPEVDSVAIQYLINKANSEADIKQHVGSMVGLTYLHLDKEDISAEYTQLLDSKGLMRDRLIPIKINSNDEVVFVANALVDRQLKLSAETYATALGNQKYIIQYFLLNFEFDALLKNLSEGNDIKQAIKPTVELNTTTLGGFDVYSIADSILSKGIDNRASDIHIEPAKEGFNIRYRIDGVLSICDEYNVSKKEAQELINHFKIKSGMRVEEHRRGQDGNLNDHEHKGNVYDLRLNCMANTLGEKIVIRILDKSATIPVMKELGFNKFYETAVRKDMQRLNGIIINTGATGSGKSTTQKTLLQNLDTKHLNIYSVEDPVERTIDGVNHICVKATGSSFEHHLQNILRQDPDVIAIGEIRNKETMDIALKAALTGHLVLATMHTNDAIGALYRFANMKVEMYQLGSALLGIGSQRLVRTLCPYCKEKREAKESELILIKGMADKYPRFNDINLDKFKYIHDAVGCNHCNNTGYYGRTVIAEYLSATEQLKTYVSKGEFDTDSLMALADNHFVPIEIDGINKVALGQTTISEITKGILDTEGEKY